MTNEEIRNEEMNNREDYLTLVEDNYVEPEDEGRGSFGKWIIGGVATALITGGVFAWKNRGKIADARAERQAKKLEKKGFTVIRPEDILEEDFVFEGEAEEVEVVEETK